MAYVNTSATPPYLTRACGAAANFTITFWIKATAWNNGQDGAVYLLDGTAASPTDGVGIEKHGAGGTLYWALGNVVGGPEPDYTAQGTSFSGWLFCGLVVAAGAYTAYVGVAGGSVSVHSTGTMGVVDNAYIHNPFSSPPTGAAKYASMKTWTAALTSSEIATEFGSKAPVRTSNIHSYMSGDSGSAIGTDQSSAGNNWTQVGTGFTTDTDLPSFAPLLSSLSPTDGATSVSATTNLAATFGENVSVGTGNVKIYEYSAPSSAPTVITRNTDAQQTNATSFVIDTPGTPIAGDLQIVAVSKDDNEEPTGTWPPTGFLVGQSDATGTTNWAGWIYRWCDGSTDPSTVTLTESSENWISRGWLIRGADTLTNPVGGTVATGTSTSANPPSVIFPGDSGDPCIVLYYVGIDGNSTFSAHPGGYSNTGSDLTTDATTGNRCGQAYGELASSTSGSDDPGTLTNTSAAWKAFTIAVRGKPTDTLVETIAITDGSKVSFSSATVTIDPAATLTASKLHYVTIDSGAILASDDSSPYLGISGRTTWNFTTAAGSAPVVLFPTKTQQEDSLELYQTYDHRRSFLLFYQPASSPPGISTETNSAFALVSVHTSPVGLSIETDSAIAPVGGAAPGIAIESDSALSLTSVHISIPGISAESDSALSIISTHRAVPGISTETETALAVTASHRLVPGIATETDESFQLTAPSAVSFIGLYRQPELTAEDEKQNTKRKFMFFSVASVAGPGISTETDSSFSLASVHTLPVGNSLSTNTALGLSSQHVSAYGSSTETDVAIGLATQHVAQPGLASDTESAFSVSSVHISAYGISNEVDSSLGSFGIVPGISIETDSALSLSSVHRFTVGLSGETDSAQSLNASRVKVVGLSSDTESALSLVSQHIAQYGIATSVNASFPLNAYHSFPPGISLEIDESRTPGSGTVTPGIGSESDTAFALSVSRIYPIGLSTSSNTAFALSSSHVGPPGVATENETSFSLVSIHTHPFGISTEVDFAIASSIGISPGIAFETNTAFPAPSSHVGAYGISVDTSFTFSLSTIHKYVPGISNETDSAVALQSGIVTLTGEVSGYWKTVETISAYWVIN